MPEPLTLDPRLEELLRELAADPSSTLLRVPRPVRLRSLFDRRPSVGPATAGLTPAERELVRAHRSELAFLLRELAVMRLFEAPDSAVSRTRAVTASWTITPRSRYAWLQSARVARASSSVHVATEPGLDLLIASIVDRATSSNVTAIEAAMASGRLEPTDQARIYIAQETASSGDNRTATEILSGVLAGPVSLLNSAAAECCQGRIASHEGDRQGAVEWYRRAALRRPDYLPATLNWFVTALDAQDRQSAESAAAMIDASLAATHPATTEFVEVIARQIRLGQFAPTTGTRSLAREYTERFESAVGVVAHVIA